MIYHNLWDLSFLLVLFFLLYFVKIFYFLNFEKEFYVNYSVYNLLYKIYQ